MLVDQKRVLTIQAQGDRGRWRDLDILLVITRTTYVTEHVTLER